jgi:hypothetical protein
LEEYEKYLSHRDLPASSPGWVSTLRLGGWAYLDAGQPRRALPLLDRALELSTTRSLYPGWAQRLRYQVAKALVLSHGDRKRAEALARQAHEELLKMEVGRDLLAEVDAWRSRVFSPDVAAR